MGGIIRAMRESRPAGFWIRVVAAAIDFALFFVVETSYRAIARVTTGIDVRDTWTLTPMLWGFTLLFAGAYTTALHAAWGQTLGKMIVGVRVVDLDGEPPAIGTALLRYVGYFASLATVFLGYIMAGLRNDKRALHDLIAGTRVERLPGRATVAVDTTGDGPPPIADQLNLPPA
jgi:uncharacterized RDD family membrane protein YckC